jgi:hypothetical protein
MNKLKLTPVSALMVQWAKETGKNQLLNKFMEHLDFSAGDELIDEARNICDWYDEVILNKKYFIYNYINDELNNSDKEFLLIFPAAGSYPHALELIDTHCHKINRIIEIDKTGMEEKQELYDRFFPQCSERIKCISADISSKIILDVISNLIEEYYSDIPSIIVLDNVSYFMQISDIKNIINSFKSSGKKNTLILDSLRPFEKVNIEKRNIPQHIFEKLQKFSGVEKITSFDSHTLETLFKKIGGELKKSGNLVSMEKQRTGNNFYFKDTNDSWLDCSVWKI